LIGSNAGDQLGSSWFKAVSGGRFLFGSPLANGGAGRVDLFVSPGTDEISIANSSFAFSPADSFAITPTTIFSILNAGTNVLLQANNDIVLSSALSVNASGDGGDLILEAGRSIQISANIFTDNGSLSLNANSDSADPTNRDAGNANITIGNGVTINTGTGDFIANIGSLGATGAVTNSGTIILNGTANQVTGDFVNNGSVNLNAGALNITGNTAVATASQLNINAGTFSVTGDLTVNGNLLNNANVTAPATTLLSGGVYQGSGTLIGNLNNTSGVVSPGNSPGTINIIGDYTQGSDGTLNMELGGLVAGSGYDVLNVTGTATLAGAINVSLFGGFVPAAGNSFSLINADSVIGSFSSLNLPSGYSFIANYNPASFGLSLSSLILPPAIPPIASLTPDGFLQDSSQSQLALRWASGPYASGYIWQDYSISYTTQDPIVLRNISDFFIPENSPFAAGLFEFDSDGLFSNNEESRISYASQTPFSLLFTSYNQDNDSDYEDGAMIRRNFGQCSSGASF